MNHKEHKLCPLLWKHLCINTNGSIKPCCEYPVDKSNAVVINSKKSLEEEYNNEYLISIRQDMLNGDAPAACEQICYKKENDGYKSKRLHEIEKYEAEYGTAFTGEETKFGYVKDIDYLDIKPSNFCNSKCVMCNNNRSSQFAVESKKHRGYKGPTVVGGWYSLNKHKVEPIYENVWRFKLNGGETTVMPEFEQILEGVAKTKNNRTNLILNINNTVDITKYHEYLKDIHLVNIVHSIEGYGKENEYIRFPAKWDEVHANIKAMYDYSLENSNIVCTMGILVMALNFKTFPFLVEKLYNEFPQYTGYYIGHIHQPEPWLVNALTNDELAEGLKNLEEVMSKLPAKLNERLENTYRFYKEWARKGSNRKIRKEMLKAIRHFDKVRNIDIKDYIDIDLEN